MNQPHRRKSIEDYDPDVLAIASVVSDAKSENERLKLDLEHANRQLAVVDAKLADRDNQIADLNGRLMNASMRLAEAMTTLKSVGQLVNAIEASVKFAPKPRQVVEEHDDGAAQIASRFAPRKLEMADIVNR